MAQYPFKVIDCYGDSYGNFATLEVARAFVEAEASSWRELGQVPDYLMIWQFVEEHNIPENIDD
jgi:hypothetical protein